MSKLDQLLELESFISAIWRGSYLSVRIGNLLFFNFWKFEEMKRGSVTAAFGICGAYAAHMRAVVWVRQLFWLKQVVPLSVPDFVQYDEANHSQA